jgi:hypothetical protein
MKTTGRIVAWLCIFSTLLTGCYSSALIDPTGNDKAKVYSKDIEYIIMKDGTRHEFAAPPTIADDIIVWTTTKSVSIPLSDVSHSFAIEDKAKGYLDRVHIIVTKDSAKYEFETLPTLSHDNIILGVAVETVSIPLSEVAEVSVKGLSVGWTIVSAVVGAFLVVGAIVGVSNLPTY